MKTKNFLELAKQGRSVPGQFVQGYTAIKMVDDIVLQVCIHKSPRKGQSRAQSS